MRLRNTSKAFLGMVKINDSKQNELDITWENDKEFAQLKANLSTFSFTINFSGNSIIQKLTF